MKKFSAFILLSLILVYFITLQFEEINITLYDKYIKLKYEFRSSLGLPKRWASLPDGSQLKNRNEVSCPDPGSAIVIVTGGQSNAANTNIERARTESGDSVYDYFDSKCFISEDPVPGASGLDGSLWPTLGRQVSRLIGRPVILVHGAIGGTQVEDWLDERSGYLHALLDRVSRIRASGYEPRVVIWHQGETDAAVVSDMGKIRHNFRSLMQELHSAMPNAKIYLFQASKCRRQNRQHGIPEFTDTQASVSDDLNYVIRGMNTDFLGNEYRWDGCHFNGAGRDEIVEVVAPQISKAIWLRTH